MTAAALSGSAPPRVFLRARWRQLLMLNYEVPPHLLSPLLPTGCELDLFQDKAIITLVAFRFLHTRVLGIPIPFHRNFDEINLRFYTRRTTPGGEARHGVCFLKELVPRRAVALLARLAYNEPYSTLPMRSVLPPEIPESPTCIAYACRIRGAWHEISATTAGPLAIPSPHSEEAFTTQRHWGHTRQRDGATIEYHVSHPTWPVRPVEHPTCPAALAAFYGNPFGEFLHAPPRLVFFAEGSPVQVFKPTRLG